MSSLRWTTAAFNDFKTISRYIELKSDLATANRVCRTIYNSVQTLCRFPDSGRAGIETGTREWVIPALPNYVVAYRRIGLEGVELLRIWHGAQDREH